MNSTRVWIALGLASLLAIGCGDDDESDVTLDGGGGGDGGVTIDGGDGGGNGDSGGGADASTTMVTASRISGGGIKDGPINGVLHVHVVDSENDMPVVGATVRVGSTTNPSMTGTTDAGGLASFTGLSGKQSVTVTAANRVNVTWIGVDGANATIQMGLRSPGTVTPPTATVQGSLMGWTALPAPSSSNEYWLASVTSSDTGDGEDPANDIPAGAGSFCARRAVATPCNPTVTTRTGKQAIMAVVTLMNDNGTTGANMFGDDFPVRVHSYAFRRGLDLTANQTLTGQDLTLLASGDLQTVTVNIPSAPSGLDTVFAVPMLDLGDEGTIGVAALTPLATSGLIPRLTGNLASNARYNLLGLAQDGPADDQPSTLSIQRNVTFSGTMNLPAWLLPPSSVLVSGNMISYTGSTGASVYNLNLYNPGTAAGLWAVAVLDGTTSFTLPTLTPDPIPTGANVISAGAMEIPGFSNQNIIFTNVANTITRLASDLVAFTK